MEIYSDCPQCAHQNCHWVGRGLKDNHVKETILCDDCGCEYETTGWVIYEEDETKIITPGTKLQEE